MLYQLPPQRSVYLSLNSKYLATRTVHASAAIMFEGYATSFGSRLSDDTDQYYYDAMLRRRLKRYDCTHAVYHCVYAPVYTYVYIHMYMYTYTYMRSLEKPRSSHRRLDRTFRVPSGTSRVQGGKREAAYARV